MVELEKKRCIPCEGGVPALDSKEIEHYCQAVSSEWKISDDGKILYRDFTFTNYYQTMAFVNAVAWMAHQENHHPDLTVSYRNCLINYTTHAIGGLSENDFICAKKVDELF